MWAKSKSELRLAIPITNRDFMEYAPESVKIADDVRKIAVLVGRG